MLTKGVFMPSSPCRGSEGRARLLKVPSLWEGWSPVRTLRDVSALIMSELGDPTKWEAYLSTEERNILPVLHASCNPSTLPQTLAVQEWIPTAISKLGRQWREMRVGRSQQRLSQAIFTLLKTFIGKLDFMLSARLTPRRPRN